MKVYNLFLLVLLFPHEQIYAQGEDSVNVDCRFKPQQLILPTALIGTSTLCLTNNWLERQNHEISYELNENNHKQIHIDDFSQYAPLASVYALNLCGLKGEHDLLEYTGILATSYLLTSTVVTAVKQSVGERRPDGSSRTSFPSGHTATAFMGAELLRHEYRDVSPWIGIAGYTVAAGTGFLRVYNNRHWAADVVAGAGIGILCAKASYWLFPLIFKKLQKKKAVHSLIDSY
jgi:hypothetical protein